MRFSQKTVAKCSFLIIAKVLTHNLLNAFQVINIECGMKRVRINLG